MAKAVQDKAAVVTASGSGSGAGVAVECVAGSAGRLDAVEARSDMPSGRHLADGGTAAP